MNAMVKLQKTIYIAKQMLYVCQHNSIKYDYLLRGFSSVVEYGLLSMDMNASLYRAVASSIIGGGGGQIFIYTLSHTIKTIDFKRN